jgi:hypothetical protein
MLAQRGGWPGGLGPRTAPANASATAGVGRVGVAGQGGGGVCWVNLAAPNRGLLGVPVGTSAKALRANGLSPFLHSSSPPVVKIPN